MLAVDDETGAARLRFVPGARLNNLAGTVFGGGKRHFATAQMSVSFLRAAKADEALIADVRVNYIGTRHAFVEVRISRERDGDALAIGTVVQTFIGVPKSD